MNVAALEVAKVTSQRDWELIAARGETAVMAGHDWPAQPGAVQWTSSGEPEALHFAPGRWLLPAPTDELLSQLQGRDDPSLVDVEGKWQRRALRGGVAWRLLACAADVEAILCDRECAALSIFDCPVIVARSEAAIHLWVLSSYAQFLDEQLARVHTRLESEHV